MDWNDNEPTRGTARNDGRQPTYADERSGGVDDASVIERTLPAKSAKGERLTERMRGGMDRMAGATRGYVSASPFSATAAAIAGGAALAGLALFVGSRAHPQTPAPLHGLRRLRAAIR